MSLIAAEDGQLFAEFNDTGNAAILGHTVHRVLEDAAERFSSRVALICAEVELTYEELNESATRLAHGLMDLGVRHGDIVGVALGRSIDLVAVLVAVLKAGAAYVPIDPNLPPERVSQMMHDAAPSRIIIDASSSETMSAWKDKCVGVDEVRYSEQQDSRGSLHVDVKAEDVAYCMYTSGSTGKPKGVEMSHGALANLLLSLHKDPGCVESDRMLAVTTISFDMAFLELFLPLTCGACVVVAETHAARDPTLLMELMERYSINMMQGTPVAWRMLLEAGWRGHPRLTKMLTAGDALSRRLADRLLEYGDALWNLYGPTETSYATCGRVSRDSETIVIGNPLSNCKLYVLDENKSLAPFGQAGELYIGGAGVARGYRNSVELTQSRFTENPFYEGKLYRTGDLARFLAPGKLNVLGRIDSQIKVRGYRVEPGDVEAAITDHDDISEAVVISRDARLIAYCVQTAKTTTLQRTEPLGLDEKLRPWLSTRLPAYMVPAFFVDIAVLPVTPNGKVDYRALPSPTPPSPPVPSISSTSPKLQQDIVDIWQKALGHNHFSINDNFFEIGGDSLRAVGVQKRLQALLGRAISSATLFEHHTIKTLAAYLTNVDGSRPLNQVETTVENGHPHHYEDIAVVSMACRLPGGITTPDEFWQLLVAGGDAIGPVPQDRWRSSEIYDADPDARGKSYSCQGGFIPSVASFDAAFFGISPKEARALDPVQSLMLETCWEGLERGGYTREQLRGSQTGVFIGTSSIPAHHHLDVTAKRELSDLDGYTVTGSAGATLSGRVSYVLGLEGPAMTIDTACSSSLVTTHLACTALRQGECEVAISGGVSLIQNPGLHVEFSRLRGMSTDGRCRAFSADSQGTGWGEGAAVVILKRLSDAQRDGDSIQAVLRATAVNHDGRSTGLTAPSGRAQERLVRRALTSARLQPDDIDYVEAHGTGTKLGDPIEAMALAQVFGRAPSRAEPLWLGSAKSNLGHTQAAAGMVGLLKVVLALNHNAIPRTLHAIQPTPEVDWKGVNMSLVQQNHPWPPTANRPRRAGVSAFGIGGTNAHAILQEPPKTTRVGDDVLREPTMLLSRRPFLLSAMTDAALRQQAGRLSEYLTRQVGDETPLDDVAFSLATTRSHFQQRTVVWASNKPEVLEQLKLIQRQSQPIVPEQDGKPSIAMLFTGQGSQRFGMGRQLYTVYPVFREALDEIFAHFTHLEVPLDQVMWGESGSSAAALLHHTQYAQPAIFGLEVALWRLWQSWGVTPSYVLGHSVGELAAAHVAGVMDLRDACRLVAARGSLMEALPCYGGMASVEANAAETAEVIAGQGSSGARVEIASYNTPTQTVISGDVEAVQGIVAHFAERGRRSKILPVSRAFHSHHMDDMLADLEAVAATVRFTPPSLVIVSSVTGELAGEGQLQQASYWVQQARNAVRFADAMQTLEKCGANVYLELGSAPVLSGMGAACLTNAPSHAWLASLSPNQDDMTAMIRSLVGLHVRQISVDWAAALGPFACRRVELPTYAFQRSSFRAAQKNHPEIAPDAGSVVDQHTYEVQWQQVMADDSNDYKNVGTWGLMCAAGPWTAKMQALLADAEVPVVPVTRLEDAAPLNGLIYLWDSDADADVLAQAYEYTRAALVQLQAAVRSAFTGPVVWLTCQAVGAQPSDETSGLGASPLWGLMRSARNEHPELCLRLVDVEADTGRTALQHALTLTLSRSEPEVAVRGEQCLVPRLQLVERISRRSPLHVRPDGAVLVSGGVGDLGARVAVWLARVHAVHDLVLISRRGPQTPGVKELVAQLALLGTTATVLACDMADSAQVKSIVDIFDDARPLRGVIHTAGVADSAVLSALTPQQCATTFGPKVDGAWHLHELTRHMDLDFFVMFSSIAGVLGMLGLGNYAAANVFLDALAQHRRSQGMPATSIAYGSWGGDGMATRVVGTARAHIAHLGIDFLSPEEGLALLEQAASDKRALTVAAALDLQRMGAFFEQRGSTPPFLRLLLGDGTPPQQQMSQADDLHLELSAAPPAQHASIVLRMVRATVATALGAAPEDVDVTLPLQDIGVDSLTAVLIRNHLTALSGLVLSTNIAFHSPNLKALSEKLLSQLELSPAESSASSSTPGTVTPLSSMGSDAAPMLDMAAVRKGCLDPSFIFGEGNSYPVTPPKAVLVTGATGFVGAFVAHQLLQQGIAVHCLVRADNLDDSRRRVVSTLKLYGLWEQKYETLLKPLVGNISQPLLGLCRDDFDLLGDEIDAICHSAALVDWMRPLEDYIGPNVVSSHEVLRLAAQGRRKSVHLISTVSTLPKHLGLDLTEEDREYGYGTSKFMAERMVAAARWRGASASVYRLPFVTASATSGYFRLDRGDFLHNLISGSLALGAFPLLEGDLSAVLPIDYLCQTIAAVMTHDVHRVGQDFDFVNGRAPTFSEFFQLIAAGSCGEEILPFSVWHRRALDFSAANPKSSLARITAVLDGYDDQTAAAMIKGLPVGPHVFGCHDYPAPEVNANSVQRYLDRIRAAQAVE